MGRGEAHIIGTFLNALQQLLQRLQQGGVDGLLQILQVLLRDIDDVLYALAWRQETASTIKDA